MLPSYGQEQKIQQKEIESRSDGRHMNPIKSRAQKNSMTLVLHYALYAIHNNVRASGVPELSCDQSHGMTARPPQQNNHCLPQDSSRSRQF